ncbi:MAG TPA: TIR domain-containing protein [Pirellulales bacterium]|nr:TIR domain-containing protein [Pirellulales bacterium]
MTEDGQDRYDVFLSHPHTEAEAVESIAARLEDEAGLKVWLDRWILIPGKPWQREMAKGLEQARTCAVFVGADTPSGWFLAEIEKALDRQTKDEAFGVIPVILPTGDRRLRNSFLGRLTWVEFKAGLDDSDAFYELVCGIRGVPPGRGRPSATRDTNAPALGPRVMATALPTRQAAAPMGAANEVVVRVEHGTAASNEASRVPRELPPAASNFVGRSSERRALADRLRAGLNTAVVGPAGMGKTALAAAALADVVGDDAVNLAASRFPDGLVYLNLYELLGQAESTWSALANRIRGLEFLERRPARERASEACRARRLLVIIEGGEEADGHAGRTTMRELFKVLSPENRWLLLTRVSSQAAPSETVFVWERLHPGDAAELLDSLTKHRPLDSHVRQAVLDLLEGHPLALNWAGNLLARDEEDPSALIGEWKAGGLPKLSDPTQAEHTLKWLFERSVRGLSDQEKRALTAAGLLAHAPFPLDSIEAALDEADASDINAPSTRDALRALVRRSLLRPAGMDSWQFTHVLGYHFARDAECSDSALLQSLGQWLHDQLQIELQTNDGNPSFSSLGNLLRHAAALLRTDADQQLWERLAKNLLYRVSDRLEELGQLSLVNDALTAVADWLARFPEPKAEEAYWRHQYCILIVDRGDVLRAQGDLAGAHAAYRESLTIVRRLVEADLSNAGWQRDLSVSHIKVGDVLRDQGDLAGALAAYRESLTIFGRLAEADPSNAGWQRELSISQERVGDVLRDQGDLAGALAAYLESLTIVRRLAEADPSNAVWQRDLSISHERVGDVLRDQGDLAGALVACGESLTIVRRLAEADPSNAGWQRDLSFTLTAIGQIHEQQGDRTSALRFAEESLVIDKRLAELDPTNVMWQRDLAISQAFVAHLRRDDQ